MIIESQGCQIKLGNGASPEVFAAVGQVTAINGPDGQASEIDVSDLDSAAREFIMGLADEGSVQLDVNYDPDDTVQTSLETMRAARTRGNFQIVLSDESPSTIFSFSAYCTQFSKSLAVDQQMTGSVTLRITGPVTRS